MKPDPFQNTWRTRVLSSRLPWGNEPVRPADLGAQLCNMMLARGNLLEDVNYQKIVPNEYIVEVSPENYARNYQPLEAQIKHQWGERLLGSLLTANSRQGRLEYRFAGPVRIDIRPVEDLKANQARIHCRVQAGATGTPGASAGELEACLVDDTSRSRWPLRTGMITIGRDPGCDIALTLPEIQAKKLVSSRHAYLYCQPESCRLFDGSANGKPSVNGTFVNFQRVPPEGVVLNDGDLIILAALDPNHPRQDTPGVAVLRYLLKCS